MDGTRYKIVKKEVLSTVERLLDEKWTVRKGLLMAVILCMPMGVPIILLYFAIKYGQKIKRNKKNDRTT